MAKPTKPKTLKPKASEAEGAAGGPAGGGAGAPGGEGQSMDMMKFIILIVVTLLVGLGGPAASMYFLGPMVLVPAIQEGVKAAIAEGGGEGGEEGEGEGEHGAEHEGPGMNLELDEFTIALKSDPNLGGTQYLRAKMALSVHVPPEQDCHAHAAEPAAEGGGHGGGGGGGADPCQEAFNKSMSVYVPGIRDIINTALMKQTATALSSVAGQEVLKDNIKNDVNNLMVNSGYEVMRVNFQDFIVQR